MRMTIFIFLFFNSFQSLFLFLCVTKQENVILPIFLNNGYKLSVFAKSKERNIQKSFETIRTKYENDSYSHRYKTKFLFSSQNAIPGNALET